MSAADDFQRASCYLKGLMHVESAAACKDLQTLLCRAVCQVGPEGKYRFRSIENTLYKAKLADGIVLGQIWLHPRRDG